MKTEERRTMLAAEFKRAFGTMPDTWSRAPGWIDLMGSHTDDNPGAVIAMTVDRDTWIAARRRSDSRVRVRSLNLEGECSFTLDQIMADPQVPWGNYVRGMAAVMHAAGYPLQGFDGLVHSTVPFGCGMSSSAAFEMALAVTFKQVSGFGLDPMEMAKLGQQAENGYVGGDTGILDPYASAMGRTGCAICLDGRSLTSDSVPIFPGLEVIVCSTPVTTTPIGSEYGDQFTQCEAGGLFTQHQGPAVHSLRAVSVSASPPQSDASTHDLSILAAERRRFIFEEHQRVFDLARVLPTGDRHRLFQLFRTSYEGARNLFDIGVQAMEAMIQAMETAPGVVAARQAGAWFGGCMVALVERGFARRFSAHVQNYYRERSGCDARIFAVQAAAGAGALAA